MKTSPSHVNVDAVLLDWLTIAIAMDEQHALALAATPSTYMVTAAHAYGAWRAGGAAVSLLDPPGLPNTTIFASDLSGALSCTI